MKFQNINSVSSTDILEDMKLPRGLYFAIKFFINTVVSSCCLMVKEIVAASKFFLMFLLIFL